MSIYTVAIINIIKKADEENEAITLSDVTEMLEDYYGMDITEAIEVIDDAILSGNIELCVVSDDVPEFMDEEVEVCWHF